jgi:hypothetical protein
MPSKLKSRKFLFALLGAVLPQLVAYLSSTVSAETALQASVAIIISYIFGQGYVDGQAAQGNLDAPKLEE